MAELEVDQSSLPKVEEVCQCFAVLEDGALAHNLQEQEIEQYYSSNVQRSQLVQNDIRVAKRLQDEEQLRAHVLHRQATQQLEEQDSEYARRIQEELQRCAEEARRREEEDEEIAKRIQEEEELLVRQRTSCQRTERAGSVLRRDGASLDLGELEQVLLDEELARRLQEQEEKLLRGVPQSTSHIQRSYPEGDFRVAQVAQDEEIARFMQKQEIRAKQQSQELDECGTGREYRQMTNAYDDSADYERQVQRDRLDSEGLLSPTEECSPEYQPPSPIAMATQQHQYRNIAEELDPTFHRKENLARQNISAPCQIQDTPEAGSLDLMGEPTFVPPTKRHGDKTVRVKSKEKKEHSKPKENCKQQ
ncbi:coiled-coil domain-containing protein 187 isoform X3 [Colossoma macropomum]|uniref:coiled-coil domain-containing protein 187 isoform X3 n=1 Tax=Colossoma macropomum TaxID=42526 RepID=UPI0018643BF6|nr:coiled-coil domain-containing protein 187 isoform X3 [Colossoma macropomum]